MTEAIETASPEQKKPRSAMAELIARPGSRYVALTYAALRANPTITYEAVGKKLGVARATIEKSMMVLIAAGYVVPRGFGRGQKPYGFPKEPQP
jgi:predicted ArsR family transcriptional regulator